MASIGRCPNFFADTARALALCLADSFLFHMVPPVTSPFLALVIYSASLFTSELPVVNASLSLSLSPVDI